MKLIEKISNIFNFKNRGVTFLVLGDNCFHFVEKEKDKVYTNKIEDKFRELYNASFNHNNPIINFSANYNIKNNGLVCMFGFDDEAIKIWRGNLDQFTSPDFNISHITFKPHLVVHNE